MPHKLCSTAGCGERPVYRGHCQRHARRQEQARNTKRTDKRKVYNSKRWRILRRHILFNQPLCKCGELATDVDHIQPLDQGGAPFALANVQPMCKSCHSAKTKTER